MYHRLEVAQEARALGRRHTADNASLLAEKRIRLQASIDDFHRKAGIYMPEMDLLSSQDNGQSPAGECSTFILERLALTMSVGTIIVL